MARHSIRQTEDGRVTVREKRGKTTGKVRQTMEGSMDGCRGWNGTGGGKSAYNGLKPNVQKERRQI